MAYFYTVDPLGFIDDSTPPPSGAIPMSDDAHAALFAGQANGRPIILGPDGVPTLGPAPDPVPLILTQAEALLGAGLTITSPSDAALDGTYSVSPTMIGNIQSEVISLLLNGTFADGGSTCLWPDQAGTPRLFGTAAVFKSFATAMARFVASIAKVQMGSSSILPSAKVTIT